MVGNLLLTNFVHFNIPIECFNEFRACWVSYVRMVCSFGRPFSEVEWSIGDI